MNLSTDLCRECELFCLTLPRPSTGHYNPQNKGRVYQKCPRHTFGIDTPCPGFIWRDDLSPPPWGNKPAMQMSGSPSTPTTPTSTLSSTPTRSISCTSPRCSAASKARAASKKCTQQFCKECCLTTSLRCQVSAHNQPPPTPSALTLSFPGASASVGPYAGPYARMIAPEYAVKIAQKDFSIAPSTRVQTESYRMETKNLIKVKYWVNDDERPHIFSVPVPAFPYFHPKDCETITKKLGIPCASYDILDVTPHLLEITLEEDDEWITTSTATLVKPNTTLYLRSPTVRRCLGLRVRKRAISEVPHSPTQSRDSSTPSPTKRPRSTPLAEEHRSVSNDNTFSTPDRVSVASSSSLPPSLDLPRLTLDSPRGKRTAFPLAYACDMDAQFRKIELLSPGLSAAKKFAEVFGHLDMEFNSSTYSNSWKAWKRCPPSVLQKAIACKHNPGGEWSPIVTAYRNPT
ncbi:hypothetical protein B0H16DRAFT_1516303 [Mycena metata]|uniref:Uncharacterized protein n=1 Tax=Mycena metata TaxID=1033252 RepID=A0AAD7JS49_9AGAR|nr:hypothetical protein B0H16DRAFT_1516303 [Mycena metata]